MILVPLALGAVCAGVERGAAELDAALRRRLRERDLPEIARRLRETGDIAVAPLDACPPDPRARGNALHVEAIAAACGELAAVVGASVTAGRLPLVLGGDHALSIGSLAGAASAGRLGVIWIDAHGDINTPATSPSGHVHGMPLAAALGRGPTALVEVAARSRLCFEDIAWIGVRDLDPAERALLRESPAVYPLSAVDELGIAGVARAVIAHMRARGVEAVLISFDLDVLDPALMPGTGTRVPGGLTYREARQLLTALRESDLPIVAVDVVELNPLLDPTGGSTQVAAGLTAVLLGETVL